MKREQIIGQFINNMGGFFHAISREMHSPDTKKGPLFADGITRAQVGIMIIIAQKKDASIKSLAARLNISPSATTQLVDGLVQKKLLVRKSNPDDRRKTCISLSEKGKERLRLARQAHIKRFSKVFEILTDEELQSLISIQQKIINNLQNHEENKTK